MTPDVNLFDYLRREVFKDREVLRAELDFFSRQLVKGPDGKLNSRFTDKYY